MFTDYCCTYPPVMSGPVGVMNIYYIQADESYNVVHIPVDDHWVMLHTISGSGQLRLEKQSYNLAAGDLLLFQSSTDFYYHCPGDAWEFWWFEFSLPKPRRFFRRQLSRAPLMPRCRSCAAKAFAS